MLLLWRKYCHQQTCLLLKSFNNFWIFFEQNSNEIRLKIIQNLQYNSMFAESLLPSIKWYQFEGYMCQNHWFEIFHQKMLCKRTFWIFLKSLWSSDWRCCVKKYFYWFKVFEWKTLYRIKFLILTLSNLYYCQVWIKFFLNLCYPAK